MSSGLQPSISRAGAPTVNDDSNKGFVKWSGWVDTSTVPDSLHVCADPTPGAAVWLPVGVATASTDTIWDKRVFAWASVSTGAVVNSTACPGFVTRGVITASTDATGCYVPMTGFGIGVWSGTCVQPQNKPKMRAMFKTPAVTVAGTQYVIGYKTAEDATTKPPTANSAVLYYDVAAPGNWKVYTRAAAGVGTYTDTGVAFAAGTIYDVVMEFTDATTFSVTINGGAPTVVVATLPAANVNLGLQVQNSLAVTSIEFGRMVCRAN